MSATNETMVQAAAPQIVPAAKATGNVANPSSEEERKKRAERRAELVARWKEIAEKGGVDGWVRAQLQSKGLLVTGDPARMSDSARRDYKAKKQAESEEKRKLKAIAWAAYRATHITHLGPGIFWREGTDPDRFDIEHREEKAKANELPDFKTADDLAKALGLEIPALRWMAFHREVDTGTHYRRWTIPKRDGGLRTITAPKRSLKAAQRWALRNIAEKLPVHGAAHGFLPSRSIVSNAEVHAGADTIVKVDIKDFFPTVHWRRVRGLLRKAGLAENIATLVSLITTEAPREALQFRGKTVYVATGPRALPQGAPTSPAFSNAVCLRMDRRLSGLARTLGFKYTRYADDLTFSWRKTAAAAKAHTKPPVGILLRGVRTILRGEGFQMHPDKTRVMRAGSRQRVTGLVVNRAPDGTPAARVPRDVVRRLRAAIHNREVGKPGKEGESLAQLKGMAAFVYMTDQARGRAFLDRIAKLEAKQNSG